MFFPEQTGKEVLMRKDDFDRDFESVTGDSFDNIFYKILMTRIRPRDNNYYDVCNNTKWYVGSSIISFHQRAARIFMIGWYVTDFSYCHSITRTNTEWKGGSNA